MEWGTKEVGSTFGCFWVSDKGKVVGIFAESASAESVDKIKRLAREQPRAPRTEVLQEQGLEAFP